MSKTYTSRSRRIKLLNPRMSNGRPVAGSVMTTSGLRWWSTDGVTEGIRKNQSDLEPISDWKAMPDDWEVVK